MDTFNIFCVWVTTSCLRRQAAVSENEFCFLVDSCLMPTYCFSLHPIEFLPFCSSSVFWIQSSFTLACLLTSENHDNSFCHELRKMGKNKQKKQKSVRHSCKAGMPCPQPDLLWSVTPVQNSVGNTFFWNHLLECSVSETFQNQKTSRHQNQSKNIRLEISPSFL